MRQLSRERLGSDWLAIDDGAQAHGRVIPPALLERGVHVAQGAHVGSLVVLAQDVHVGAGSKVERAVVLDGHADRGGVRAARLHPRGRLPGG